MQPVGARNRLLPGGANRTPRGGRVVTCEYVKWPGQWGCFRATQASLKRNEVSFPAPPVVGELRQPRIIRWPFLDVQDPPERVRAGVVAYDLRAPRWQGGLEGAGTIWSSAASTTPVTALIAVTVPLAC